MCDDLPTERLPSQWESNVKNNQIKKILRNTISHRLGYILQISMPNEWVTGMRCRTYRNRFMVGWAYI